MKPEFPSDNKYIEVVHTLDKWQLRLTTGNCGIFAVALQEVFQTGTLFTVGDFAHILLKHNGKFYDGETIYPSIEELKLSHWGQYFHEEPDDRTNFEDFKPDEAYDIIQSNTNCTHSKEFFEDILKSKFELVPEHHQITLDENYTVNDTIKELSTV